MQSCHIYIIQRVTRFLPIIFLSFISSFEKIKTKQKTHSGSINTVWKQFTEFCISSFCLKNSNAFSRIMLMIWEGWLNWLWQIVWKHCGTKMLNYYKNYITNRLIWKSILLLMWKIKFTDGLKCREKQLQKRVEKRECSWYDDYYNMVSVWNKEPTYV